MTLTDYDIDRIADAVVRKLAGQQKPITTAPVGSFAYRLQQAKNDLIEKGGYRK